MSRALKGSNGWVETEYGFVHNFSTDVCLEVALAVMQEELFCRYFV